MDTKLDEKPSTLGTYSIPSAVLYVIATTNHGSKLHLTTKHLYHWTKDGLAGGYLKGIRNRKLFINFRDLISLRAIAAMRATGMRHADILTAEKVLKKRYDCEYPFATVSFWTTPPRDVFVKEDGVLLSASRHLQSAMEIFEEYLQPYHNLTFDIFGISANWQPYEDVLFDPTVQYGNPCIHGTRVPTEVISSFHDAGDSVENLAFMYGLQRSQIENAIEWEKTLKSAAAR